MLLQLPPSGTHALHNPQTEREGLDFCDWVTFHGTVGLNKERFSRWLCPNPTRPADSSLWLAAQEEVREIQCMRAIQHTHAWCLEDGGGPMPRSVSCLEEQRANSQPGHRDLRPATRGAEFFQEFSSPTMSLRMDFPQSLQRTQPSQIGRAHV